jgi:hypothetical protein
LERSITISYNLKKTVQIMDVFLLNAIKVFLGGNNLKMQKPRNS